MKERFIGEIVKERRLLLEMTQAELCEGICEPITISRLEQNKQTPARNTVKAIFQRLGLPDDRYFAAVTGKEIKIDKIYNDIVSYNIQFEKASKEEKPQIREMAIKAHSELENIIDKDDTISLQLLARSRVIIGPERGEYTAAEKIILLEKALRLTQPNFRVDNIRNGYFDYDEVKLINHIALACAENDEHEKAIDIWEQLLDNVDKRFSNIVPVRTQKSLILVGYSKELGIVGKYDKAIDYVHQGIDICIKYGIYQNLPELIMILAECKYRQGKRDESKELFIEAYYLCKTVRDDINLSIAINSLQEYFHTTLN
jgi:transcriptional regulator with XRE-family HTH domain